MTKLAQPELLKELKQDLPEEFQFRRGMAESAYQQCLAEGKSETTIQYMKELVEFYDGI